ncbi:MAG: hypothetical protein IH968_16405 [Gemmatimonadetes bacterium]|nr:hypothetical protein [Gemmatimonadota bacterium]
MSTILTTLALGMGLMASQAAAQGGGSVTGLVTDSETQQPSAGAQSEWIHAADQHRLLSALLPLGDEAVFRSLHRAAQIYHGAGDDAVAQQVLHRVAPGRLDRILTSLASTAVGAGLGFFASQVVRGDWSDGPGQPQMNRTAWAAVGGALGLAVGFTYPLGGRARAHPPTFPVLTRFDRSVVTLREIQDAVALNAYQAVRRLRPEWLVPRPPNTFRRGARATVTVYLDDFRLGGPETLRGLNAEMIGSIRFVSAGTATARWGPGNSLGVIQVVMRN